VNGEGVPKSVKPTNTYDFIVVGAGTAGCVIAARLSENATTRVLLLEAGGATPLPASAVPPAWPSLLATESCWGDSTTVQTATGRSVPLPRGRGIGGSSAVNAMVFARGHRASYDRWETVGATGWGFDDLLPYFKRTETAAGGDPALRGVDGPLRVGPASPPNVVLTACLLAAVQSGYARARDISGGLEVGFGPVDLNIHDGWRQSAADAYLTGALDRPNLDFVADATVHRLCIKNGRCTGVDYTTGDGTASSRVSAAEVVLAAGAVGSPQVLLQSGIGPPSHLADVGIDVTLGLPGVGENLHDHPLAAIAYRATVAVPPPHLNYCEVIGLVQSDTASDGPDVQMLFVDGSMGSLPLPGLSTSDHGYGICVSVLQPYSRGTVRLSRSGGAPLIDPNYFGDDRDMRTMLAGLRLARRIGAADALAAWRSAEAAPGPDVADDEALRDFVKSTFTTYFHPVGTCAMGTTDMSVVDSELRVRGMLGVRVADASVMPSIPSNNTNATVYAIAERGAELIGRG
jgi:choline dehydrogenase